MGKVFFWNELTTLDFAGLDPDTAVAVLPLASTEQHGPHLPLATDTVIANGMLGEVRALLPDGLAVLVLPTQEIGKANEHVHGPGTLSQAPGALIEAWTTIGHSVASAGLRKIVLVNSHGGNSEIVGIVARELRVRFAMAAVATHWGRFGAPDSLFDEGELRFGIHGGDMETSLMLHFRPDLVRMDKARDFRSAAEDMARMHTHLQPTGPHALAWVAHDLNPDGVVGNAAAANAEKGAALARHQAEGFVELLQEVAAFPLDRLYER